jgi:hypothetical protein
VALPEDVRAPAATRVAALLSLGQQGWAQHRLTGHQLPEVDVTAVEPAETMPASAAAADPTADLTARLTAQRSTVVLDSDYLRGNDGAVLLLAATVLAGAEHLMGPEPRRARPPGRERQSSPRHRQSSRGKGRRSR